MLAHPLSVFFSDQIWLVLLAAVICIAVCYAAVAAVSNLCRPNTGCSPVSVLAMSGALGLAIAVVQYAVLLGVTPSGSLEFDAVPITMSLVLSILGTGAGLSTVFRRRRWAALGGAAIGATAAGTNYLSLLAIDEGAPVHINPFLVLVAGLTCALFSSTSFQVLLARGGRRRRLISAALLSIGILALDIMSDMGESLHHHLGGTVAATAIAERWIAIGIIPAALIILVLALFANTVGRYLAELAEGKRALEGAMQNLQTALYSAEREKDARERILAHMSHELRTPLNAILGFSDLMRQQTLGKIDGRYREYLDFIHDSGTHLLGLINKILDIAKIDAGQFELREEDVDVAAEIAACMKLVSVDANAKDVRLSGNFPGPVPLLYADREVFRQILINLLSNAVKFTPNGGQIVVSAGRLVDGLRVVVKDTGVGIDPVDMPRVLERFGQIDNIYSRTHKGSGLGLALVKEFMEAHQGAFEIDSELGAGTAVTLKFPQSRLRRPQAKSAGKSLKPALAEPG